MASSYSQEISISSVVSQLESSLPSRVANWTKGQNLSQIKEFFTKLEDSVTISENGLIIISNILDQLQVGSQYCFMNNGEVVASSSDMEMYSIPEFIPNSSYKIGNLISFTGDHLHLVLRLDQIEPMDAEPMVAKSTKRTGRVMTAFSEFVLGQVRPKVAPLGKGNAGGFLDYHETDDVVSSTGQASGSDSDNYSTSIKADIVDRTDSKSVKGDIVSKISTDKTNVEGKIAAKKDGDITPATASNDLQTVTINGEGKAQNDFVETSDVGSEPTSDTEAGAVVATVAVGAVVATVAVAAVLIDGAVKENITRIDNLVFKENQIRDNVDNKLDVTTSKKYGFVDYVDEGLTLPSGYYTNNNNGSYPKTVVVNSGTTTVTTVTTINENPDKSWNETVSTTTYDSSTNLTTTATSPTVVLVNGVLTTQFTNKLTTYETDLSSKKGTIQSKINGTDTESSAEIDLPFDLMSNSKVIVKFDVLKYISQSEDRMLMTSDNLTKFKKLLMVENFFKSPECEKIESPDVLNKVLKAKFYKRVMFLVNSDEFMIGDLMPGCSDSDKVIIVDFLTSKSSKTLIIGKYACMYFKGRALVYLFNNVETRLNPPSYVYPIISWLPPASDAEVSTASDAELPEDDDFVAENGSVPMISETVDEVADEVADEVEEEGLHKPSYGHVDEKSIPAQHVDYQAVAEEPTPQTSTTTSPPTLTIITNPIG